MSNQLKGLYWNASVFVVMTLLTPIGGGLCRGANPTLPRPDDLVWDSPSTGANGSMPLGNGEVGVNVWVEKDGDLRFYVSRTDAWSECCTLLKLGRVRVHLDPNPFAGGLPFRQTLNLLAGRVDIAAGGVNLRILVDGSQPVVYLTGSSDHAIQVQASVEIWRTAVRDLKTDDLKFEYRNAGSWTMRGAEYAPKDFQAMESADVIDATPAKALSWYHRNAYSIVPMSLKLQGLQDAGDKVHDPLINRTFGGLMAGAGLDGDGKGAIHSAAAVRDFELKLVAYAAQTDTLDAWRKQTQAILRQAPSASEAADRTAAWWRDFWDRSWIRLDGFPEAAKTTQAYTLQRWMNACGGRGSYPIKFNGSIFTVDPKYCGNRDTDNPDWRAWGDCFWWQNTRLPYQPMPASGDFDLMKPLFAFYRDAAVLGKARARIYHHVDGLYFPETMNAFGTYGNGDYGWGRTYAKPSDIMAPAWQYCWHEGLELVNLMLDYYDYTTDDQFLAGELLPTARDVLAWFASHFPRDAKGTIVLQPTQVLETYRPQDVLDGQGKVSGRQEVINDTPTVAGLHSVLERLLALPAVKISPADRAVWEPLAHALPPLPLSEENGKPFIRPAQQYPKNAWNIENAELYAVSPFRLFCVGKPDIETARNTYRRRLFLDVGGWTYDGQCAALLGMTDEAKRQLLNKIESKNANFRFPAMWGPNYDWLPDQTLGGNLMLTLQDMILQSDGDKMRLLPAWPRDWNVRFKLHAPKNTVVEGVYREGKFESLSTMPPERMKDLVSTDGTAPH